MCPTSQSTPKQKKSASRLQDAVRPSNYKLRIMPDISNAKFSGEETITLTIAETVKEIVLHAAEISISTAALRNHSGNTISTSVKYDEEKQQIILSLDAPAEPAEWQLELHFDGILNNKLRGFYRSTFKDASGAEKQIATTKFEPSDARRAFPCFDEPEFKAVFEISLLIDENLTAIANSPIVSETAAGSGKKLVQFAPSIKMSSYLVAYIVGEFEASAPVVSKSGTPIRVVSVPGKQHLTAFALKWAKFSLDFFADFFGINYPGEKLDLIAIPDFASGAMENFGAITFRETALLLDETKATHAELQRVAEVISHENAHMWFGDLVTMDWWNGLWLNEAFATFMAALAVDAFEPSWKFWEGFNIHKAAAMRIDGLHSSRSIEFPVATPEDARAMFDILTYEKGCAILRMLQLYIGEEVFRKGCATYMKRHAYANTETADLWAAIGEAVHEAGLAIDVEKMMDTWVFQKGFPLIAVQRNENNSVTLSQSAFRYLIDARASAEEIWYAPVFVRYATASGDKHDCFVLFKKQETFKLKDKCSSFVLNADGKGFFRGSYASDLRKEILAQIITLSASERFNLISDWWAATQSGKMSLLDYLDSLSSVLAQETDSNVFSVVIGSINYLRRICAASSPDKMPQFVNAASELLEPALNRLGWEAKHNEEPQAAELRASLISTLGSLGQKNCVEKTAAMWQQY